MRRAVTGAVLVACSAASFVAGGYYWEPLLFGLPQYCLTGIHVVDGDTVRCEGRNVRLRGFDTPEMRRRTSECTETERMAGLKARCLLKRLVASGDFTVRPTYKRDDHFRPLADLIIKGVNVGLLLERQGFARFYSQKSEKPDWCKIIGEQPDLLDVECNAENGNASPTANN